MFVHFAPESTVAKIRRKGIARSRRESSAGCPKGTYAVPVTRDFYLSHQWLRELKRRGGRTISAVYFRIPDDEIVWVGHYNHAHQSMTAAEAVAVFISAENREGWEVVVPRRVEAKEIHLTKVLPQIVGWRFFPGAITLGLCVVTRCAGTGVTSSTTGLQSQGPLFMNLRERLTRSLSLKTPRNRR